MFDVSGLTPMRTHLPEHKLLAAVLRAAIADALPTSSCCNRPDLAQHRKDALSWLLNDSISCSPLKGMSFLYICEALDLDAFAIRKAILAELNQFRRKNERLNRRRIP